MYRGPRTRSRAKQDNENPITAQEPTTSAALPTVDEAETSDNAGDWPPPESRFPLNLQGEFDGVQDAELEEELTLGEKAISDPEAENIIWDEEIPDLLLEGPLASEEIPDLQTRGPSTSVLPLDLTPVTEEPPDPVITGEKTAHPEVPPISSSTQTPDLW